MSTFGRVVDWFGDPAHWAGANGVPQRLLEHLEISGAAVATALLVALPIGIYIGHARRFELLTVSIVNLGRAVPSLGVLAIAYSVFLVVSGRAAFGFGPTFVAMTFLAIPPILTNTYVGIQGVDPDAVEAARGMGMSEGQIVRTLELPLAVPLVVAGIRTATVQVIATATLAAVIGGGGLGRYIIDGFAQQDTPMTVAGAVLVAVLALAADATFALIERLITPRTSSGRRLVQPGRDRALDHAAPAARSGGAAAA